MQRCDATWQTRWLHRMQSRCVGKKWSSPSSLSLSLSLLEQVRDCRVGGGVIIPAPRWLAQLCRVSLPNLVASPLPRTIEGGYGRSSTGVTSRRLAGGGVDGQPHPVVLLQWLLGRRHVYVSPVRCTLAHGIPSVIYACQSKRKRSCHLFLFITYIYRYI